MHDRNASSASSTSDDIRTLAEQIKGIRIAMLTTEDEDGCLRSRPMYTQEAEFDGELWFFTGGSTPKCDEIRHHQQVNLSYANPDEDRYVSVSGTAEIVRDRQQAEKFWSPLYKAWFRDGLDDPDLALLKVNVTQAEYWSSPSSTVVKLFGFAKAMVTGERAQIGEHEDLEIGAHA